MLNQSWNSSESPCRKCKKCSSSSHTSRELDLKSWTWSATSHHSSYVLSSKQYMTLTSFVSCSWWDPGKKLPTHATARRDRQQEYLYTCYSLQINRSTRDYWVHSCKKELVRLWMKRVRARWRQRSVLTQEGSWDSIRSCSWTSRWWPWTNLVQKNTCTQWRKKIGGVVAATEVGYGGSGWSTRAARHFYRKLLCWRSERNSGESITLHLTNFLTQASVFLCMLNI